MNKTFSTTAVLVFFMLLCLNASAQSEQAIAHFNTIKSQYKLSKQDVENHLITSSYKSTTGSQATHTYLTQTHANIEVMDAHANISVEPNGQVLSMHSSFVANLAKTINTTQANILPQNAVEIVARLHSITLTKTINILKPEQGPNRKITFDNTGIALEPIDLKLIYKHNPNTNTTRLAWNVSLYKLDGQNWWQTQIDALTGEVIDEQDWVVKCNWGTCKHTKHAKNATLFGKFPKELEKIFERTEIKQNLPEPLKPQKAMATGDYNVFAIPAEAPTFTSPVNTPTIVNNPWNSGNAAAAVGLTNWHFNSTGTNFTNTRGNNVWAQDDINNNNGTATAQTTSAAYDFGSFAYNLAAAPNTYINAANVNLFYMNNIMHDIWYQHGFDEPSGNFQANNLSRGGTQNDAVFADSQDGGGTNNANFATPADGTSGRMQMYIWTAPTPDRDGGLDNGIVAHEYGHGISTRLVGGPAVSCLTSAEQQGEGWSDWFGLMLVMKAGDVGTTGKGIGTYALGEATTGLGIRDYRYSTNLTTNPFSYASIKSTAPTGTQTGTSAGTTIAVQSQPHGIGSVWCTMLWEMTWELIAMEGFTPNIYTGTGGNVTAMKLVIEGLKRTPCAPGFVDARDAILAADKALYNGVHVCAIWKAFAKRGLGFGATQGSSNDRNDGIESYALPALLVVNKTVTSPAAPSCNSENSQVTFSITAKTECAAQSNVQITDILPAGLTYISSSGGINNSGTVTFPTTNIAAGASSTTFTLTAQVGTGLGIPPASLLNQTMEGTAAPTAVWSTNTISGTANNWVWTNTAAASGTRAYFAANLNSSSESQLRLINGLILQGSNPTLTFNHRYNTELDYDFGYVEISTNNGASWSILASYSGTAGTAFTRVSLNLATYRCQTVVIRFRMTADANTTATAPAGWWIDDVAVGQGTGTCILNRATATAGSLSGSGSAGVCITTPTAPLNVDWYSVKATAQSPVIVVDWTTLSETNNASFEVERTTNKNSTSFEKVATFEGSGTTKDAHKYVFEDKYVSANTAYFYRIKQVDVDGKFSYSTIVSATVRDNSRLAIKLFPNPAKDKVAISITGGQSGMVSIVVLNGMGQVIVRKNVNSNDILAPIDLQLPANLPSGLYNVNVVSGRLIQNEKLIVE